jgi:hypothetical protein
MTPVFTIGEDDWKVSLSLGEGQDSFIDLPVSRK